MEKTDIKKTHKALYRPPVGEFALIEVPALNYFMIDGAGDPNTAPAHRAAIEALYAASYTLKFMSKEELKRDYVVPPLEGLWCRGIRAYNSAAGLGLPFALAYTSINVTDARSELGLRGDKSFAIQDGITLRGRAAWAHDVNRDRAIGATFQTLPGASFVVNGARQAADAALVTDAAEMKWLNGWSAAATFEGEFSDVTRSYAGKGVVRYAW